MIENPRPYLVVKRLIVRAHSSIVYDENFHVGVNIIRGHNSSGKSSILDFIFYVLGGEVAVWKSAAELCTDIYAEVEINGAILTLHRVRNNQPRTPISIFYGPIEESAKHRFDGWRTHSYVPGEGSESFSAVLFRLLGIPAVKSDKEGNITVHQILRLAYIDQISRTTSLMKEEDWDSPLKRQMVADLLFGVYNDRVYELELYLQDLRAQLKDIKDQIKYNTDLLLEVGGGLDSVKLAKRSEKINGELLKIDEQIAKIQETGRAGKDTSDTKIQVAYDKVLSLRQELAQINNKISSLSLEMQDSDSFIKSLIQKHRAINDSLLTKQSLGEAPNCPLCNIAVKDIDGEMACQLSGRKIPGDFGMSSMVKMRDELAFQIKESERLQVLRQREIEKLYGERAPVASNYEIDTRLYQQLLNSVKSTRDSKLDEFYHQKGTLEAELKYLGQLLEYVANLANSQKRKGQLDEFIMQSENELNKIKHGQFSKMKEVMSLIKLHARDILSKDLDRQHEFENVESIDLSFQKNIYYLNGKQNYSASSNAFLKNAIVFSILFASCQDAEFRYPRFLLCDNMEDAGMEEERSQAFQRIICDKADSAEKPYQIIYTTSMIEERLNRSEYTIGDYYTKEHKTLRLPAELQKQAVRSIDTTNDEPEMS